MCICSFLFTLKKITYRVCVCLGLSLKSQELTALFLIARFITSIFMEYNIHTLLDFLTLSATAWVVYMIRFNLKSTYMKDMDTFPIYFVVISYIVTMFDRSSYRWSGVDHLVCVKYGVQVVPAAILAFISYPKITHHHYFFQILFGFSAYVESLSVLPQLRLMQNAKVCYVHCDLHIVRWSGFLDSTSIFYDFSGDWTVCGILCLRVRCFKVLVIGVLDNSGS